MNDKIKTPKHSDLIYDVGMHRGEDTEFYLRKGFRVVSFEANPELAKLCRNRLKSYLDKGQLKIVEGAIVDADAIKPGQTKVVFYKNNALSDWGTVCTDWAERNARLGKPSSMIEVDVINFQEVMQENGVPHFLKIDIEGADTVCLESLKMFQERPDYVSIESDKTSFANIKREIDTLMALGYDSFQAVEQSMIPKLQTPPQPPKEGHYAPQSFEHGSSGLFGAELNGEWKSYRKILHQYRAIRLGYVLLGNDGGILNKLTFPGSWQLQSWARSVCRLFTNAEVPGWYDTHARHQGVNKI